MYGRLTQLLAWRQIRDLDSLRETRAVAATTPESNNQLTLKPGNPLAAEAKLTLSVFRRGVASRIVSVI